MPLVNVPDPVLPTATLIPDGVDVTRSPLRPLAVTVNIAVPLGVDVSGGGDVVAGVTVRAAERVTPLPVTEMVTMVVDETAAGRTWMLPRVVPAGMTAPDARNGVTAGLLLVTRTV